MNVLIACEFSGIVREAFRKRGHSAISCDLLPSEQPGPHLQMDILTALGTAERSLGDGWTPDLMIAHPPCTYLCNSGVRWLYGGKGARKDTDRWGAMVESAEFFKALLNANIYRVCVENPIMHSHAAKIVGRRHDQLIQPGNFGHQETKATCLWLKNLPPLESTKIMPKPWAPRVHHASPGPDRWKERSRTLTGIADAMAEQWGSL